MDHRIIPALWNKGVGITRRKSGRIISGKPPTENILTEITIPLTDVFTENR